MNIHRKKYGMVISGIYIYNIYLKTVLHIGELLSEHKMIAEKNEVILWGYQK